MSITVPHEWKSLLYTDPSSLLVNLRKIQLSYPLESLRYAASSLRTHELRIFGEGRQAALFCYGIGQALGTKVSFAQAENQDYDIIIRYKLNDQLYFAPVQLKEWVPETVNSQATLQTELNKLKKYVDSKDLIVAFYLNRDTQLHFSELSFPKDQLGELWFFGAIDPSQAKWMVAGNFLGNNVRVYEFSYPT